MDNPDAEWRDGICQLMLHQFIQINRVEIIITSIQSAICE